MKRRALIIFCSNTPSNPLKGPIADEINVRNFLISRLGGNWLEDEILSLHNPMAHEVQAAVRDFLSGADYTFTLFSGHGFINPDEEMLQFIEVMDYDLAITSIISSASRQTIIIDACRGIFSILEELNEGLRRSTDTFSNIGISTREIFDKAVLNSEIGNIIIYSADEDESAGDHAVLGGFYTHSLIAACKSWKNNDAVNTVLRINHAHDLAIDIMDRKFPLNAQQPQIDGGRRRFYFPIAVKHVSIF